MADNIVRNVAPFINDRFLITTAWWTERWGEIHRGLDIATSGSKPVYSILKGGLHSKGTSESAGNWVIIADTDPNSPTYGYATRYLHLAQQVEFPVGHQFNVGDYVAMEGSTGESTGIHLHVEMQNIRLWNWQWHFSYTKTDYLDPTVFMGIDNIEGTWWIYNGHPQPQPTSGKRNKFPWVLYSRKLRNKRMSIY